MKDPGSKDSYFLITPPTFILPSEAPDRRGGSPVAQPLRGRRVAEHTDLLVVQGSRRWCRLPCWVLLKGCTLSYQTNHVISYRSLLW